MGNKQCGGLAVIELKVATTMDCGDAYCARSQFDPFLVKDLEDNSLNVNRKVHVGSGFLLFDEVFVDPKWYMHLPN